jgi:HlyD family secretion protein
VSCQDGVFSLWSRSAWRRAHAAALNDKLGGFSYVPDGALVSDLKSELASLQLHEQPPRSRRGLWIAIAVLVILAAAGVAAWRTSARFRAVEVQAVTPTVETGGRAAAGTPVLTASGYIVARREAIVSSKIQGRLAELRVEEGSVVETGDVLARLESVDFVASVSRASAQLQQADAQVAAANAQIRRAEADLAEARRQLAVADRLSSERLIAEDSRDAARSRVALAEASLGQTRAEAERALAGRAQAKAELAVAQAQLQNTVIRAPFSGTVVRKMAEVGESVAPIPPGVNISTASGAIVALADLATLEMEADVSEANVARLQEGQPAEVTVEAFPDRGYRAVLRQVIPTADRTKATVLTKVTLLNKDEDLKPEMSAKVTFLEPARAESTATDAAPARPTILVPSSAIVTRNGQQSVFEIVDDVAKARPVTTSGTRQDMVIVADGLAGSERLVARPPDAVVDGTPVTVRASQGAQ